MADDDTQVLRQLGAGWLECRDSQGIFFYNPQTKEVSVEMPVEVHSSYRWQHWPPSVNSLHAQQVGSPMQCVQMGPHQPVLTMQPVPMPPARHLQPPAGSHNLLRMVPQLPTRVSDSEVGSRHLPPVPERVAQARISPQSQPVYSARCGMGNVLPSAHMAHSASVDSPSPRQEAVAKLQLGDWVVYQDDLGPFYYHIPSQQQFENPPPQLLALYHRHRAEQDQIFEQKMLQIRQQQELLQQHHFQLQQHIAEVDKTELLEGDKSHVC